MIPRQPFQTCNYRIHDMTSYVPLRRLIKLKRLNRSLYHLIVRIMRTNRSEREQRAMPRSEIDKWLRASGGY